MEKKIEIETFEVSVYGAEFSSTVKRVCDWGGGSKQNL
jgi:hypothetical protein